MLSLTNLMETVFSFLDGCWHLRLVVGRSPSDLIADSTSPGMPKRSWCAGSRSWGGTVSFCEACRLSLVVTKRARERRNFSPDSITNRTRRLRQNQAVLSTQGRLAARVELCYSNSCNATRSNNILVLFTKLVVWGTSRKVKN